jgi:hypothetical protein
MICKVSRRGVGGPGLGTREKRDPLRSWSPRLLHRSCSSISRSVVHRNVSESLFVSAAAQRHECRAIGLSLELDGGYERLHLPTSFIFTEYVESPAFDTLPDSIRCDSD